MFITVTDVDGETVTINTDQITVIEHRSFMIVVGRDEITLTPSVFDLFMNHIHTLDDSVVIPR